jgi:hypothetical protein
MAQIIARVVEHGIESCQALSSEVSQRTETTWPKSITFRLVQARQIGHLIILVGTDIVFNAAFL